MDIKIKNSQAIFVGIMIFIMVLIATISLIPLFKSEITTARDTTHLDCGNSSITPGTKMTCVLVDLSMFYFIGISIASAAGYITMRKYVEFIR